MTIAEKVSEKVAEYRLTATPSPKPDGAPATDDRRNVRLFRNGANQAVRIPKEFELPGHDAVMFREGHRIVIEALADKPKKGTAAALAAALESMKDWPDVDEPFPDVDEGLLPLDDIEL